MATLRMRFTGMCLFHQKNGAWLVRLLDVHEHEPTLWFNNETCRMTSTGADVSSLDRCIIYQNSDGVLDARKHRIQESPLKPSETITIKDASGMTGGMPGAISCGSVHPGLSGVDEGVPVAVVIELRGGDFVHGPMRDILWNKLPGGTSPPHRTALWTDFVLTVNTPSIQLQSDQGSRWWRIEPIAAGVHVWVVNHFEGQVDDPRVAHHFEKHFALLHGARYSPYPELRDELPTCETELSEAPEHEKQASHQAGHSPAPPSATLAAGGSSFCPDGQYP